MRTLELCCVGSLAGMIVGCGGGSAGQPETQSAVAADGRTVTAEPAAPVAPQVVQTPGDLRIGGQEANFGVYQLSTGFEPDPATMMVTSGGTVSAADALGMPQCTGWVTRQPDVIVRFDEMYGFLRFAFRANVSGQDATLVINDPTGQWYCNDDAVGRNPVVDFPSAQAGQYDVWVGSYQSGAYVEGSLLVTELETITP